MERMTATEGFMKYQIQQLEEENKKLKEKVSELEDVSKDYDLLSKDFITLGEENEKLNEEIQRFKDNAMQDMREITELEIENKKLKEKVRFLEECLDRKEKVNKKLREELSAYDREYFDEDKKAKNIFIEEDTLQELRDIGKL